ncbi:14135_t:CDS:2 [Acaulospora morrowiae]|uniref:triacylglycerol lipase n=1 Tax=Acaulospora morrowiae TaxID=94023 RepID=A0A9N9BX92_9GLOM|nr:14135_t:CDS:2 [Acaulospora morrowiae]
MSIRILIFLSGILFLKFILIIPTWAEEFAESGDSMRSSPEPIGELRTVTLKHVYHHGSSRFPKLLRRKDFTEVSLRAQELETGESFTHAIRIINGTSVSSSRHTVEEFRQKSQNDHVSLIMDWKDKGIRLPKIRDLETLTNFAKMTYNAYTEIGNEDWYDLGDRYRVNDSFGWDKDGIRGHVFGDANNEILIISLKGTSMGFGAGPTVPNDKLNDNLLFSCCCANVDRTWTPVCKCRIESDRCDKACLEKTVDLEESYYNVARRLFERVSEDFPKAQIWLTGHSLGGALSALVGNTFGVPVVAFESPGERLPAQRLHLPGPPALPYHKMNIWHIGHSADPIYMGVCNGLGSSCYIGGYAMETKCHLGFAMLFDVVEKFNWRIDVRTHRIKDVIERILNIWEWELPKLEPEFECEDCGYWNFIDV